jgi:hypothetical protein
MDVWIESLIWRSDVFDENSHDQLKLPDSCRLILMIHNIQYMLTGIERAKEGPATFRVYSSKKVERGSWIFQKMENLRSRLTTINLDVPHEQVRPERSTSPYTKPYIGRLLHSDALTLRESAVKRSSRYCKSLYLLVLQASPEALLGQQVGSISHICQLGSRWPRCAISLGLHNSRCTLTSILFLY